MLGPPISVLRGRKCIACIGSRVRTALHQKPATACCRGNGRGWNHRLNSMNMKQTTNQMGLRLQGKDELHGDSGGKTWAAKVRI